MITRLYVALLQLYPKKFRTEFSVEMEDVFRQATSESKSQALSFFFRELRDFPANLVRQHWAVLQKEAIPMTAFIQTEKPQPGTWGEAFLAGLPHLLMALLIGIGKLFDQTIQINQNISIVMVITLGLLVTALLILAWRRGWPLWSASWYLYGSWVVLAILSLGIMELNLEGWRRYTNALFVGWVLFCIIGYFVLLMKSKLHGLLSVAFLFPLLSLMMMEFVPNPIEGWLAISVGLLAALTAGFIVRVGYFRLALGVVIGFNLTVGLTWAYISEYKMLDLPTNVPAHVPKFSNFLEFLALYSVFGLGIVAFPFILRGLWNFGKRRFG
jgi:hypothetical protein